MGKTEHTKTRTANVLRCCDFDSLLFPRRVMLSSLAISIYVNRITAVTDEDRSTRETNEHRPNNSNPS